MEGEGLPGRTLREAVSPRYEGLGSVKTRFVAPFEHKKLEMFAVIADGDIPFLIVILEHQHIIDRGRNLAAT